MLEDTTIDYATENFTFTIMKENGEEVQLVENGANIKVTHQNKKEYISKIVKFYLY